MKSRRGIYKEFAKWRFGEDFVKILNFVHSCSPSNDCSCRKIANSFVFKNGTSQDELIIIAISVLSHFFVEQYSVPARWSHVNCVTTKIQQEKIISWNSCIWSLNLIMYIRVCETSTKNKIRIKLRISNWVNRRLNFWEFSQWISIT